MSKKLISENGIIKCFELDSFKLETYKILEREDGWYVYLKATKQLIETHKTEEDARRILYDECEIDSINDLNCEVKFSSSISLKNLLDYFYNNKIINNFIEKTYPNTPDLEKSNDNGTTFLVALDYYLDDNNVLEYKPRQVIDWKENTKLITSEYVRVYNNSVSIAEGEDFLSLFDLIRLIFDQHKDKTNIVLSPNGLNVPDYNSPMEYLFCPCEIKNGTTVLDIFNYIIKNKELSTFISNLENFDINQYYEIAKSPIEKTVVDKVLIELELQYFKELGSVSIYNTCCGINEGDKERYALDLISVSEFSNCPVMLSHKIIGTVMPFVEEEEKIFENIKYKYTFFDILEGLFDEIGFFCTPEAQEEQKKEIFDSLEDYKESKEAGEICSRPLDELIDELERKQQEEDEEYE